MTTELVEVSPANDAAEISASLPFPFKQQTYCRYEPVEQRLPKARVLVIDNLLRDEHDAS